MDLPGDIHDRVMQRGTRRVLFGVLPETGKDLRGAWSHDLLANDARCVEQAQRAGCVLPIDTSSRAVCPHRDGCHARELSSTRTAPVESRELQRPERVGPDTVSRQGFMSREGGLLSLIS